MISMVLRTCIRNLFRFICHIATLLHPNRYKVPVEEQFTNEAKMTARQICWWLYKYYYRPVELPAPDVAGYFTGAAPDWTLPADFVREGQARIAAGGDILVSCHVRGDNTAHLWDAVAPYFFDADITCANLESPVAPSQPFSPLSKNLLVPLKLNNSPAVFDACYREGRGINLFSTANNHAMDRGEAGLLETLDFLDSRGTLHTGTARDKTEQNDVLLVEKNGIRIAFLSYTFSLNNKPLPDGKEYLVNLLPLNKADCDTAPIREHIKTAKTEKKADAVIAMLHWGQEFESYPVRHFIDLGHELLEAGIDVIIGNHAHGLQPFEHYPFTDPWSGLEKKGLIFYALGDLLSWHPAKNTRLGCLAKIHLQKGHIGNIPLTLVSGLELKPTYLYSAIRHEQCSDFRVLDLAALAREIEEGTVTLPLTENQKSEALRLRSLSEKVMPQAYHTL